MNAKPNSKNRGAQLNFRLRTPVCFVGANIEFFKWNMS